MECWNLHWMLELTLNVGTYTKCWNLRWMLELTLNVGTYTECWDLHWMLELTLNVGTYAECWNLHWMLGLTLNVGTYTECWNLRWMLELTLNVGTYTESVSRCTLCKISKTRCSHAAWTRPSEFKHFFLLNLKIHQTTQKLFFIVIDSVTDWVWMRTLASRRYNSGGPLVAHLTLATITAFNQSFLSHFAHLLPSCWNNSPC